MCPAYWVLLLYLLLAALWDIHLYRVPNRLTALAWLTGFGLVRSLSFLLCGAGVLLVFYLPARLRMLGGGDAKLFAVAASFLGIHTFLTCLFFTFLTAAALSVFKLVRHPELSRRFAYFFTYAGSAVSSGRLPEYRGPQREAARVPMAAAAFAGWLLTLGAGLL